MKVPPGSRKKAPATLEHWQLLNRFTALKSRRSWLCFLAVDRNPGPQRSSRSKQPLIAVNDSLLQRPEVPDLHCRKVSCLPGNQALVVP